MYAATGTSGSREILHPSRNRARRRTGRNRLGRTPRAGQAWLTGGSLRSRMPRSSELRSHRVSHGDGRCRRTPNPGRVAHRRPGSARRHRAQPRSRVVGPPTGNAIARLAFASGGGACRRFPQNGPVLVASKRSAGAPEAAPAPSGIRSGALLAAAIGASIVLAYVFLLAAGRLLGSDEYGSLAALLGLLSIVLLPAASLQMAVSREVSRYVASGATDHAARLARGIVRAGAI